MMSRLLRSGLFALLLCVPLLAAPGSAKGLTVVPSRITWRNVEPGRRTDARSLVITNISRQKRTYALTARKCEDIGAKVTHGYEDIPDVSWVRFERRHVPIDANCRTLVRVWLDVPEEHAYSGRKWQFYIEVREVVPQYGYLQGRPDRFGLAIFLKARISMMDTAELNMHDYYAEVVQPVRQASNERMSEVSRFAGSGRDDWFCVWNMICLDDESLFDMTACSGMGDSSDSIVHFKRGGAFMDICTQPGKA